MTTKMFKSAKRSRLLINDLNKTLNERPNILSIEHILGRIVAKERQRLAITSAQKSDKLINKKKRHLREKSPKRVSSIEKSDNSDVRVFKVIYGSYKPNKKHKQFSFDGFLTIKTNTLDICLVSIEGKSLNKSKIKSFEEIESGKCLVVGQRELQIDDELSSLEFFQNKYFIKDNE